MIRLSEVVVPIGSPFLFFIVTVLPNAVSDKIELSLLAFSVFASSERGVVNAPFR